MNYPNQLPENDKKAVGKSSYQKRYYLEKWERILTRKQGWRTENAKILNIRRKRQYL